jgi:hypothetical protein
VANDTQPAEPVVDDTQPAEPVADDTQPAEPVVDDTQPGEPVADDTQPAEPVVDDTQPSEPVANDTQPALPVDDEPAYDDTQPPGYDGSSPGYDGSSPGYDGTQPAAPVADDTQPADNATSTDDECFNVEWDQCGGEGHAGQTCCPDGFECAYTNEWWSMCSRSANGTNSSCAAEWGQCGGAAHKGPTCCLEGLECVKGDEWWSMCSSSPSPPPVCDPPLYNCTGHAAIDAILNASDVGCHIGLTKENTLYSWSGFCGALRNFNQIDSLSVRFSLGNSTEEGLVNIASLLAQTMYETGGDVPFSSCDESNYRNWENASCTQREDGKPYAMLNEEPWACGVDASMTVTAATAESYADAPLKCEPGTITESCCWWGRGAIQTTGPNNYGRLQQFVLSQVPELNTAELTVNVCTNPEVLCLQDQVKWVGAIFLWATEVQGHKQSEKDRFETSLRMFVDSGFNRSKSVVDGADFAQGCGNMVNKGGWTYEAHGSDFRVGYFDEIISLFKEHGMKAGVDKPKKWFDLHNDLSKGGAGGGGGGLGGSVGGEPDGAPLWVSDEPMRR